MEKMNLLMISNSTNAGEEYLKYPIANIAEHLKGVTEVLFVPYAAVTFSYDEYERKVQNRFDEIGIKVRSVHREKNPAKAVREAQAICVGGGNTFALTKKMQKQGLMKAILRKVKQGTPYVGWSAGSNVCCPTICQLCSQSPLRLLGQLSSRLILTTLMQTQRVTQVRPVSSELRSILRQILADMSLAFARVVCFAL